MSKPLTLKEHKLEQPLPELLHLYDILAGTHMEVPEAFIEGIKYGMSLFESAVPRCEVAKGLCSYAPDEHQLLIYDNDTYIVLFERDDLTTQYGTITVFTYDERGVPDEEVIITNLNLIHPFEDLDEWMLNYNLLGWDDECREDTKSLLIALHSFGIVFFRDNTFTVRQNGELHAYVLGS